MSTPAIWACWCRPAEAILWPRFGLGFENFEQWLKDLGIVGVRMGSFSWSEIETKPGVYEFNTEACPLDDSMARLRRVGLDCYLNPQPPAPEWAMELNTDPRLPVGTMVPNAAKLEAFVKALAARYPYVKRWGFGNENDADSDPLGGLAAFGGDWRIPAQTHYHAWLVPFARAVVRSGIPGATLIGPETMTYGYANTILTEDNKQTARSIDVVSVHGYAMNGLFPEAALARLKGAPGSLTDWMLEGGAQNGRKLMLGEMGIEHGEAPDGLLTYLRDPRLRDFEIVTFLGLDNFLAKRPPKFPEAKEKGLEPNGLYYEFQAELRKMRRRRRGAVRS